MRLYIFGEGETEKRLINIITAKMFPNLKTKFKEGRGINNLCKTIQNTLGPELNSDDSIRCVILIDKDFGKSPQEIRQSFEDCFSSLLTERNFKIKVTFKDVTSNTENIFFFSSQPSDLPDLNLKVALHIAQVPEKLEQYLFNNATTDHYILSTALTNGVLNRFAEEVKVGSEILLEKVTQEIPRLMEDNEIIDDENKKLDVKDLISAYMTASRFLKIKRTEHKETFTGIVINRAFKYARDDMEKNFKSIIASIKAVVEEETEK